MSARSHARVVLLAVAAVLATPAASGCIDVFEPDVGGRRVVACDPEDSDPSADVSFVIDVLPLLTRAKSEGGCSCHMSEGGTGAQLTGLVLSSYDALRAGGVNSGADIVVEGDPCISVLYLKTGDAPPFGSRMPLGGPTYWTDEERALLHDWIAEGAEDD